VPAARARARGNGTQGARTGPAPGPTFETRNLAPARAEVRDADGRVVGQATFTQGRSACS
jgi:hypothetical protein